MGILVFMLCVIAAGLWATYKAVSKEEKISVENWQTGGYDSENKRIRKAAQTIRR